MSASADPAIRPATTGPTERSRWIDAARGVGIVLVVAGHNPGFWLAAPEAGRVIFAFHVPLFFAVAGTTASRRSTWRAAALRAAGLWLSYLALCVLSLPLAMRRSDYESLLQTLLGILYGTGHTIVIPPLWFLPCLALTVLAVHAIDAARARLPGGAGALWGDAVAALACAAAGVELLRVLGPPALEPRLAWGTLVQAGAPWNLDLLPISAGFFIFGRLLRELVEYCAARQALLWGSAAACTIAWAGLDARAVPRLDLNQRVLVPGFMVIVVAALACTALMLLVRGLQHTRAGLLAAALGTKTLVILWLHAGLEKRAWEAFAESMPTALAVAASITLAVLLPYALDVCLMRLPRVRGVIYPQAWLAAAARRRQQRAAPSSQV
jgi:fucose 4-O-acetylase-like acetyltransferase